MYLELAVTYVVAGAVIAIVFGVSGARLNGGRSPWRRTAAVSLMAGAIWPVVLLGLIEYGVVAALAKLVQVPRNQLIW